MPSFSTPNVGVATFCVFLSAWCIQLNKYGCALIDTQVRGYILENRVTHARLLPAEASHAFTYPTIAFLMSLNALENHKLDVWKGWLFGYGGRWGRLTGVRANPYLADPAKGNGGSKSIREKLVELLIERGYIGRNIEPLLDDAWMLTMPNYLGFEGINPLTVYFCYKVAVTALWLVVLEVHNTFGETHVYILEVGQNEDPEGSRPRGYDYQWTLNREFHVSPFNDRSGFYTISVKRPSHPPMLSHRHNDIPRPAVRIHLHTSSITDNLAIPGPLKLTALLQPTASYPLTAPNLLLTLSRTPFTLFLSLPRILAQAWTLHYRKSLDVFIRPEPFPPPKKVEFSAWSGLRWGGGVKWQDESPLERFARLRVQQFFQRRVEEIGLKVSLVSADPAIPDLTLAPRVSHQGEPASHLVITYLAPRFFTILFTTPSPQHALLLGSDTERVFSVSSREFFITAFSPPLSGSPSTSRSSLQHLRAQRIPPSISLPIPASHPLDPLISSRVENVKTKLALRALFLLGRIEHWIFSVVHARVVEGDEPWEAWTRAEKVLGRPSGANEIDERTSRGEWGSR
ncbi:hypothetical protein E4T56_gene20449 [Termitomyces sp. T112]|nr:hypothetical protein E4T56_gene20449 [Termitomyces sp. T112]